MKKILSAFLPVALIAFALIGCNKQAEIKKVKSGGPEVVMFRALQFPLTGVKLLDGPFRRAMELDKKTLLAYEPDRLLARFYSEAGLKPKAEQYHGWEDETIAGHSLGHYLSAISMMYQTTGDQQFLDRVNYIVSELKFLQDHDGEGYIGAFPNGKKILTEEVAKGNIRSQGFDLNGIWVPFYTQHKILAGLRDAYRLCGNKTALEISERFAGWLATIVAPLNDEQVQKMLRCEHGGIAEVLADLYADTGDERYLRLSRTFYQKSFLDPLKEGKDVLPGKHCNTNIPKITGLSRLYELTGDSTDRKAAEFFWNTVVSHHSYVTGGNGNNEYFGPADQLRNRLGEGTTESCNVYNMLKLTEHLFEWEASAKTGDFYERALFNHILSTQNPADGRVTYNLSLDMGGFKDFQDPYSFTCCVGTGMENHAKYGRNIYYHNDNELFLFQYISSELTWKEKGLTLIQNTNYPEEQGTSLEFKCEKPVALTIQVRYPYWAMNGIEIRVNGSKKRVKGQPGSYIPVSRTWKTGDRLEVKFPFTLRLEAMPDDSSRVAVMYGPLVMAGDLGPLKDSLSKEPMYVPVLMTGNRNPASWLKQVEGRVNTFVTVNTGRPRDVELRPFYTFYDRRYTVYWDMFTEQGWKVKEAEYKAEMERIAAIKEATIDFVQPGEMQPERDHNFKGERTTPGSFKERANRESRGGWFSFDMKSKPDLPIALVVEYWGGFPGAKTFDILVNNKPIATENISNKKEGQFILVQYDIPREISAGKSKISVMFRAHENNMAGPVFGVRTTRKQAGEAL
jgi:uncharacterized protein